MSYCFETLGSVFVSTSLCLSVSGILKAAVLEKCFEEGLVKFAQRDKIPTRCGRILEAQIVRINIRGQDIMFKYVDVTVRSED